jgi:hypothetical protein
MGQECSKGHVIVGYKVLTKYSSIFNVSLFLLWSFLDEYIFYCNFFSASNSVLIYTYFGYFYSNFNPEYFFGISFLTEVSLRRY